MAPRKVKIDYGEKLGTCEVCSIALWSSTDSKPAIFPCNIKGCPYEKEEEQNQKSLLEAFSMTGSGLSQID